MPAGRPKSIDESKVFDVAKPGMAKPVGTSRPVIVNHSAGVADKSVINGPDGTPSKLSAPSISRKVIKPISISEDPAAANNTESAQADPVASATSIVILDEPKKAQKTPKAAEAPAPALDTAPELPAGQVAAKTESVAPEAKKDTSKSSPDMTDTAKTETKLSSETTDAPEVAAEEPKSDNTAVEKPTENAPADQANPTETDEEAVENTDETAASEAEKPAEAEASGSDAASVDAVAEASTKSKEEQKAAEEQIKRDAALQDMIDSKKYFVPLAHDSSKTKKRSGTWVAVLILLVIVAGAYAAIDSKIIDTGISLPYHFFKQ